MNTSLKLALSLGAACVLAQAIQPARANSADASDNETVSRTVRFGDLDLATQSGKSALNARLRTAAGEVCDETVGTHYGLFAANSKCRSALVEEAVAKIFGTSTIFTERLAAKHKNRAIELTAGR